MSRHRVYSYSEAGGHPRNEDAWGVAAHQEDEKALLCVVADGMGGQPKGGAAAQRACQEALVRASTIPLSCLRRPQEWSRLLAEVDQVVAADDEAGLTTLVALIVWKNQLVGASCGDSAAVAFSAKSPAEVVTRHQQKNPPVGSGGAFFAPFAGRFQEAWSVLLVTDGVWTYVGWERLLAAGSVASGEEVCKLLRQQAGLRATGELQDDFTLLHLSSVQASST